jgi:hypothetical protein
MDNHPSFVRIYQPSKTATQSGRGNTKRWVLEYEIESKRRPEPLMGWTSSEDTLNQVRLRFDSKEDAVAFARKKGWQYSVEEPRKRRLRPRNYAQNFQFKKPWEA